MCFLFLAYRRQGWTEWVTWSKRFQNQEAQAQAHLPFTYMAGKWLEGKEMVEEVQQGNGWNSGGQDPQGIQVGGL